MLFSVPFMLLGQRKRQARKIIITKKEEGKG